MARKRKRTIIPPDPGDIVTMRPWIGTDWMTIQVVKLTDSPIHGVGVHGYLMEGGQAQKTVTLPLSHLIEEGRATRIGHGKWDVELPDGKVTRHKSKKAAIEFCQVNGVVFTEVSL